MDPRLVVWLRDDAARARFCATVARDMGVPLALAESAFEDAVRHKQADLTVAQFRAALRAAMVRRLFLIKAGRA